MMPRSPKLPNRRAPSLLAVAVIVFLLAIVSAATWLRSAEPRPIWGKDTRATIPPMARLRVVMDNNYPPYVFLDRHGNPQGILVDQWALWEKATGVKVELAAIPWEDALDGMKAGKYEVIDTIFQTAERAKNYEFTAPYARMAVPIFFQNNISGLASAASLTGFRVAVKLGDANVGFLKNAGVTNLVCYGSYEEVVQAAATKKEAVFVIDEPPARFFLYKYGIQEQFSCSQPLYHGAFHRAVKKGDTALLRLVENGFARIPKAEYEGIDKRWFGIRQGESWRRYLPYLGSGIVVVLAPILVLIVLNGILQHRVRRRTRQLEDEIAERRHVEMALRESEERYRELVERANSIILRMDTEGTLTFINEFAQRLFGFTPGEILGRNAVGTIVPLTDSQGRDLARMVEDIGKHPERYPSNENENMRKDGTRIWVAWTNQPTLDDRGRCVEIVCVGNDITERKRAEDALRKNQARQSAMIANIADVVAIIDPDGINRYQSPNLEKWFGWRPEEIVGLSAWDNIHPEDLERTRSIFGSLIAEPNASQTAECRYRCKNGGYKWIEFTAVNLLHEQNINGILLNYHDIDGKKQAEAEQRRLQGELAQAQKMESVGRLAGGVAHDFNNMLGVILGYAEVALEEAGPAHPLCPYLEEIRAAAKRSSGLTRQLLAFARKQTIAPQVLDLNATMDEMLNMLRRLIGENIELLWRPGADLWPVKMDPAQVDQILANLSVNARDAIAGVGKIIIETKNLVCDEAFVAAHPFFVPGEYVLLAVNDTGCGMDRETQARLFEPFFTTKPKGQGTGLGLATVYGIVKQNQGFITVDSEPGAGTTFRIYLPRFVGQTVREAVEAPAPSAQSGPETVLLVEDEMAYLRVMETLLARWGYTVLAAGTPGEALRLAGEHAGEIHLLMTDMVLPEMNGRDLQKQLVARRPGLKSLFVTGYTASQMTPDGVLDPGVHLLQKPFSMEGLAAKVREALEAVPSP